MESNLILHNNIFILSIKCNTKFTKAEQESLKDNQANNMHLRLA